MFIFVIYIVRVKCNFPVAIGDNFSPLGKGKNFNTYLFW